jgi:(p)ppGpp synthase/HD superfamily hydrolase
LVVNKVGQDHSRCRTRSSHLDSRAEDVETVAAARAIAYVAHRGQVDKAGAAYIDHPRRVAERLTDPAQVAAAWLHDVIEDCDVSADDLGAAGIPDEVVEAVVLLTRTPDVPGQDYYAAIRENPIAGAVKLADIADNTDEQRLARLPEETQARLRSKYAAARQALGAPTD